MLAGSGLCKHKPACIILIKMYKNIYPVYSPYIWGMTSHSLPLISSFYALTLRIIIFKCTSSIVESSPQIPQRFFSIIIRTKKQFSHFFFSD